MVSPSSSEEKERRTKKGYIGEGFVSPEAGKFNQFVAQVKKKRKVSSCRKRT
jgi:hypothetical protein